MYRRSSKGKMSRKSLFVIFSIVTVCVIGLTVAYAALSSTLNISGNVEVNAAEWGLKIEEQSLRELVGENYNSFCNEGGLVCGDNYLYIGSAKIEKFPTINGTSLDDYSISVTKPGDYAMILYKVTNVGSLPAKLNIIDHKEPTYTSFANNPSDVTWAAENFYIGSVMGDIKLETAINVGHILCPGESADIVIAGEIMESVDSLPSSSVTISNISSEFIFTQTDDSDCPV